MIGQFVRQCVTLVIFFFNYAVRSLSSLSLDNNYYILYLKVAMNNLNSCLIQMVIRYVNHPLF